MDKYLLRILLAACKKSITKKCVKREAQSLDGKSDVVHSVFVMERISFDPNGGIYWKLAKMDHQTGFEVTSDRVIANRHISRFTYLLAPLLFFLIIFLKGGVHQIWGFFLPLWYFCICLKVLIVIIYVQKSKFKFWKKEKPCSEMLDYIFFVCFFFCLFFLIILTAPWQGLNNAVALDFDYRQQMIYWTDVTTQGSMIRRMYINGSDVQVGRKAGGETQQ